MQITIEIPDNRLEQLLASVSALNGIVVPDAELDIDPNNADIWAAIHRGRAQIAEGKIGTLDDLALAMRKGIAEGAKKRS